MAATRVDAATAKRLLARAGRSDELTRARTGRSRPKPSRAVVGGPLPGRCRCGQEFPSEPAWEKHHDELGAGHGRFDIIGLADDMMERPTTQPAGADDAPR